MIISVKQFFFVKLTHPVLKESLHDIELKGVSKFMKITYVIQLF